MTYLVFTAQCSNNEAEARDGGSLPANGGISQLQSDAGSEETLMMMRTQDTCVHIT